MTNPSLPKEPLPEHVVQSGLREVEEFLGTAEQDELDHQNEMAEQIYLDSIVVDRLLGYGLELPNPRDTGLTLIQQTFELLPATPLAISQFPRNVLDRPDRYSSVMYHAKSISAGMHYQYVEEGYGPDPFLKSKNQLAILDDKDIAPEDKSALLNTYDDFVPVGGLDLTDQEAIDEVRAEVAFDKYDSQIRIKMSTVLANIIREDLIPSYGHHDDYQKFGSSVIGFLATLKGIKRRGSFPVGTANQARSELTRYRMEMSKTSSNIGMGQEALRLVVELVTKLVDNQ
jgi:hypothetical protein